MSVKTIAAKLQIKPGAAIWASDAARLTLLGPLPEGSRSVDALAEATAAVVFADNAAGLRDVLAAQADALTNPSVLWVAYPKGNRADINRDTLWPILRERGLRPISQVALDEVWSALRFRPLQPGEAFHGGQ